MFFELVNSGEEDQKKLEVAKKQILETTDSTIIYQAKSPYISEFTE